MPTIASPAVTASSPRISAAMTEELAGCAGCAGWPVAARSDGVASSLAAVDATTLADGAEVAAA